MAYDGGVTSRLRDLMCVTVIERTEMRLDSGKFAERDEQTTHIAHGERS